MTSTKAGKIRSMASGRDLDEAMHGIRHPNVQTVQIIFNMFRLKPADQFFAAAQGAPGRHPRRGFRSLQGLLTGKLPATRRFAADDHRSLTARARPSTRARPSPAFPMTTALEVVEELKKLCPPNVTLAQFALRWILMFDAVTCASPAQRTPSRRPGMRPSRRRRCSTPSSERRSG